jgi:hypothetical protein
MDMETDMDLDIDMDMEMHVTSFPEIITHIISRNRRKRSKIKSLKCYKNASALKPKQ